MSLDQFGCGPVHPAGTSKGLYERHLFFDNVSDQSAAEAGDRFEAPGSITQPSGAENIYKAYAESFQSEAHLNSVSTGITR